MPAREVCFTGAGEVTVRERSVPDPEADEVRIRAEVSAISPGTELLIYQGDIETDLPADDTLESLSGSLSYPVTYGYATVGQVIDTGTEATELRGSRVLAFHPHASEFVVPADEVVPVPDLAAETAVLLPNAETAVNLGLDGEPAAGERVLLLGQGVVGLLTTALLDQYPLEELVTADFYERRRSLSTQYGADVAIDPDTESVDHWNAHAGSEAAHDLPQGADLTYELSGNPAALEDAIDATGFGGRVIVGSWYGTKTAELSLDSHFHRGRIEVTSSQVSTLAPQRRGRWTKRRRLDTARRLLREIDTEPLVTHRIPVADAARAYELLDTAPDQAVQVLLTY